MSRASVETVVVLVDIGRSMAKQVPKNVSAATTSASNSKKDSEENGQKDTEPLTALDSAKQAVELFIQQKLLFSAKDEIAIVFFGAKETKNAMNEELGGYDNVYVHRNLEVGNVESLQDLQKVEPSQDANGDVLDALVVALDVLRKNTMDKKKCTRRVFLVTGGECLAEDDEQAEEITSQFNAMETKLDVVGVNYQEKKEWQNLNDGTKLVSSMAEKTGGHVLSVNTAVEVMSAFRSRHVNSATKFRGNLSIGGVANVPVWTYARTAEAKLPTLKKVSTVGMETGEVKMNRTHRSSETQDELEPEDTVKAHRFGKDLFPVDKVNELSMQYNSERSFDLIGFTDKKNVPRYHYCDTVDAIIAPPGDRVGEFGVSALASALQETGKVAIVRYVKRKNAQPLLGVLTPQIVRDASECEQLGEGYRQANFDYLHFNRLPFAEDLRDFPFHSFTSDENFEPSEAQREAASNLIDDLDLTRVPSDDGVERELLNPVHTFNPILQRFYQTLQARAYDDDAPIPPLPPAIEEYVNPDKRLFARAAASIEEFKNQFPLKVPTTGKGKKRQFWGDYDEILVGETEQPVKETTNTESTVKEPSKKRAKGDEDADNAGEEIVIGDDDPTGDFKKTVERRDKDMVEPAMKAMMAKINTYAAHADKHEEAMECLEELREAAIEHHEEDTFNEYLKAYKSRIYNPQSEEEKATEAERKFWMKILTERCTLISQEEGLTNITDAQADDFLLPPTRSD